MKKTLTLLFVLFSIHANSQFLLKTWVDDEEITRHSGELQYELQKSLDDISSQIQYAIQKKISNLNAHQKFQMMSIEGLIIYEFEYYNGDLVKSWLARSLGYDLEIHRVAENILAEAHIIINENLKINTNKYSIVLGLKISHIYSESCNSTYTIVEYNPSDFWFKAKIHIPDIQN